MTHPHPWALSAAGVAASTQEFGPMDSATVLSPFGPIDQDQFRALAIVVITRWAALADDATTHRFEFEDAPGVAVNVSLFEDQRHGLCAAVGYPTSTDRDTFQVEFWPVTNREAPFVKIWETPIG